MLKKCNIFFYLDYIAAYICILLLNCLVYFDIYKFYIYYLNDKLINLCIIFSIFFFFFLNLKFFFFSRIFFYSCIIYYLKLNFFFFKYCLCFKYIFFLPTLLHGYAFIHPPVFYLSIVLGYYVIYQNYYFNNNNYLFIYTWIVCIALAFILGGFWSLSLFTWGFYWVYDLIEYFPVFFLSIALYWLHVNIAKIYNVYTSIMLIFLCMLIYSIRLGFFKTRHSFFVRQNFNSLIFFSYTIGYQLIFFHYRSAKRVDAWNFYFILIAFICLKSLNPTFIKYFFFYVFIHIYLYYWVYQNINNYSSVIFILHALLWLAYVYVIIFDSNYIYYYFSSMAITIKFNLNQYYVYFVYTLDSWHTSTVIIKCFSDNLSLICTPNINILGLNTYLYIYFNFYSFTVAYKQLLYNLTIFYVVFFMLLLTLHQSLCF